MRVSGDISPSGDLWVRFSADQEGGNLALNRDSLADLEDILVAGERSPARCLVIAGDAGTFCSGLDLMGVASGSPDETQVAVDSFANCLNILLQYGKPVIALVDGMAAGGGVAIASAADLVVVTRRARFCLPELDLGLVPGMALPVLLQRVSPRNVRWLAMEGRAIGAEEAVRIGLADEIADSEGSFEILVQNTGRHLSRCIAPGVLPLWRRLILKVGETDLNEALRNGNKVLRDRLTSQDVVARMHRRAELLSQFTIGVDE